MDAGLERTFSSRSQALPGNALPARLLPRVPQLGPGSQPGSELNELIAVSPPIPAFLLVQESVPARRP